MQNKSKRNYSIDIAKLIMAYLIIAMHITPLVYTSETADFILRSSFCTLGVPFFIMCSGYFLGKRLFFDDNKILKNRENKNSILKMIKRIAVLYIGWSIAYLMFSIPQWIETGWLSINAFVDFGLSVFTIGSHYHLWYLLSVLYALIIIYFIIYKVNKKYYLSIAILLYAIEITAYAYSILFPSGIYSILTKLDTNCLFLALFRVFPYLLLGIHISQMKKLKSTKIYLLGFIVFLLLSILEAYFIKFVIKGDNFSNILTTIPRAYFLFCFVLKLDEVVKKPLNKYLIKANLVIYCIHPLVIEIIKRFYPNVNHVILFILTAIISTLSGVVYYLVKDKCRELVNTKTK